MKKTNKNKYESALNGLKSDEKWGSMNVATPFTERCTHLASIYDELKMTRKQKINGPRRMRALMRARNELISFLSESPSSSNSNSISISILIELIERELEMRLIRKRPQSALKKMTGLKSRIDHLFFQCMFSDRNFNPILNKYF